VHQDAAYGAAAQYSSLEGRQGGISAEINLSYLQDRCWLGERQIYSQARHIGKITA
jgi:hypothetical protein